MVRKTYEILTWDSNLQEFTPQAGVRRGPYRLFGLRKPLRELRDKFGYGIRRHFDDFAVLVQER